MIQRIPLINLTILALGAIFLASCGPPPPVSGIHDPYEAENRLRHANNRMVDETVMAPVARAYGQALPDPVRAGLGNVADNLSLPSVVVNKLLQGKIEDAAHNTVRFVLNSTLGFGGLLDPGADVGLEKRDTDFGETLYVWGADEGPYLVAPLIGPTTTRDAAGRFVDLLTNPLRFVVHPAVPVAGAAITRLDDHAAPDPDYAQTRLDYLHHRRQQLGSGAE
ncbi:MAG: VacJ family lipoprotein [Paracoccaceae bacterium]